MQYTQTSQTYVERTTDEEILVGASRARRLVRERGEIQEVLRVDGDWKRDDQDTRRPLSAGALRRPGSRKQLGGS